MLRMLDRHAVQELLRAGLSPRAVARQFGVSRRTIERIGCEAPIEGTVRANSHCVCPRPSLPTADEQ